MKTELGLIGLQPGAVARDCAGDINLTQTDSRTNTAAILCTNTSYVLRTEVEI